MLPYKSVYITVVKQTNKLPFFLLHIKAQRTATKCQDMETLGFFSILNIVCDVYLIVNNILAFLQLTADNYMYVLQLI